MTNPLVAIARHLSTKAHLIALQYAKRVHDAEEIAQDALVKLFSCPHRALRAASSAAYLDTTIRNAAYDYFRKVALRNKYGASFASYNQVLGVAETVNDTPVNVTSCSYNSYDGHLEPYSVAIAMRSLSENERRILELVGVGYSYEEIAKMESIPVGTVRSRLHSARRRLTQVLEEDD